MLMVRLLAKLILIATALTLTLVVLTHALTYDQQYFGQIDRLLTPVDCVPPCFMGIRPGVTTASEAITVLTAHVWVSDVITYLDKPRKTNGLVCWHWSGQQPPLIDSHSSTPACAHTHGEGDIITGITVPTAVAFGDAWILWHPKSILVANYSAFSPEVAYTAIYSYNALYTTATLSCPIDLTALWRLPTVVEFGEMANQAIFSNMKIVYPDLHAWQRRPPC